MTRRVVITGMGVVTPNALNLDRFLAALQQGRSGISRVKSFSTANMRAHLGAEVKGLDRAPRRIDRVTHLAATAAGEAMKNSGLSISDQYSAGVVVGTICGGLLTIERFILDGERDPRLKQKTPLEATAKFLADEFKLLGGSLTVSNACASGTAALALAHEKVKLGKWEYALAGGTESFYRLGFSGFNALRSLDPVNCRPFDAKRQGLVIGEGAGFLVLESLEQADRRGAPILAEVLGFGLCSDACHETSPDPTGSGPARAMRLALKDAGISAADVSYINAHGTGTPLNDAIETLAIKKVFGRRAYRLPVSSTKSMIGHLMGAAGAVEAVASVLALAHGFIPPTINYKRFDPQCDLDYVPNRARQKELSVVMSSSFGFGGNNAVALFGHFGDRQRQAKGL